jgi:hypothetical protein
MEQKEIIQIIKDLRDCPKGSTSKWHVDICANKLIDNLETKQLILSGVSGSFSATDVERAYDDGYSTNGEVTFDINNYL